MRNQKRNRPGRLLSVFILLGLVGGYVGWSLLRPLPMLNPTPRSNTITMDTPDATLVWPAAGQSAVGIVGTDTINTYGKTSPAPIASTAKVITALMVLDKKPLKPGEAGPSITISDADVASYKNYRANDGSLVPVIAGEQINERQMIQAIMLPSANNIADTMASWAFGSIGNYSDAANTYLLSHGLKNTHVGNDASGFSPTTTSTAEDLVKLGKLAMSSPVLTEIVGQSSATGIPQTTSVKNVNSLLGTSNIIGVKTGNTTEAGGVFISASRVKLGDKPVTIITAVAGSPDLAGALKDSLTLIKSAQANLATVQLVKAGDILGRYQLPQGGSVEAVAAKDLKTTGWKGSPVRANMSLEALTYKNALGSSGHAVGKVITAKSGLADQQTINLNLKSSPPEPSALWRLTHPLN